MAMVCVVCSLAVERTIVFKDLDSSSTFYCDRFNVDERINKEIPEKNIVRVSSSSRLVSGTSNLFRN